MTNVTQIGNLSYATLKHNRPFIEAEGSPCLQLGSAI